MDTANVVKDKSLIFAVNIVKLCRFLQETKKEFVISHQLLKSGTSIGANIREAEFAQSKSDWYAKLKIAEKEANETDYWLILLYKTDYITEKTYLNFNDNIKQICKILASICKTKTTKSKKTEV